MKKVYVSNGLELYSIRIVRIHFIENLQFIWFLFFSSLLIFLLADDDMKSYQMLITGIEKGRWISFL